MANPYADTEPYATAWQHGHDHGVQNPAEQSPPSPDFAGWGYDDATTGHIVAVWQEGALAGRDEAQPAADAGASLPGGVAAPPAADGVDWTRARVHTVKFWLNAFISPAHVDGPPGAGLLFDYEYFSGDNRGYSSAIHASSRLHSEIEITGVDTGHPKESFQWSVCGESHALDSTFAVVDTKTAVPGGGFGPPEWDGLLVSVHYQGTAAMPLLQASPDVDVNGTFSVDPFSGQVSFHGLIDSYPWFEGYASVNNGSVVTLFTEAPSGGPESLFGDAARAVSGSAAAPVE